MWLSDPSLFCSFVLLCLIYFFHFYLVYKLIHIFHYYWSKINNSQRILLSEFKISISVFYIKIALAFNSLF